MLKHGFLIVLGFLAVAATAEAAGVDPGPMATVRAELEATFAARHAAYEAKDFDTLMKQVSPDYSAIRPDGTRMTRDDLGVYIRRNLDRWVRITYWSNKIETLRLDGANAVVDMRQHLKRIQIVDGREAEVESKVLQTETWTPTAEGWKLLAVRDEREQSVTVDGRPVR
jgi:hypothetical protein